MKKIVFLVLMISLTSKGFCQNGTSGNPFTALGQAQNVTTAGQYFFNIGGVTFDTWVDGGNTGWIVVATGSGAANALTGTTSISALNTDKILNVATWSTVFSAVTGIRFNAQSGPGTPFDVTTTNANNVTQFKNNVTISDNQNTFNTGIWAGTGEGPVTFHMEKRGGADDLVPIASYVFHANGNANGMLLTASLFFSNSKKATLYWGRHF